MARWKPLRSLWGFRAAAALGSVAFGASSAAAASAASPRSFGAFVPSVDPWRALPPHLLADGAIHAPPPGLRLKRAIVLHRHGDRTPLSLLEDLETEERTWIPLLEASEPISHTWRSLQATLEGSWLVDMSGNARPDSATADHRYPAWWLGQLTPSLGVPQAHMLGRLLRDRYVYGMDLLPPTLSDSSMLYARSSNVRRTVMTLDHLLLGLYPARNRDLDDPRLTIYASLSSEMLFPRRIAPPGGASRPESDDVEAIRERLSQGLPRTLAWSRAMEALICRQAHRVPLPPEKTISLAESRVLLATSVARWRRGFPEGHGAALAVPGLLAALQDRLRAEDAPPLTIYSGHDSTMFVLLRALGQPMPSWPPYCSWMGVELFQREDDPTATPLVRVVFNGQPLRIDGMGDDMLMELPRFLHFIDSTLALVHARFAADALKDADSSAEVKTV